MATDRLHDVPRARGVSIHATLAGGDQYGVQFPENRFTFLSTPPSRVATRPSPASQRPYCVSIHATLAGGDPKVSTQCPKNLTFLSTPPSRVATPRPPAGGRIPYCFYPRHPRGWRPNAPTKQPAVVDVSIHATLAGGDHFLRRHRTRCGLFLSTPPSRVATHGSFCNVR